jgi:hypothetical protein
MSDPCSLNWCKACNEKHSGNVDIDKFIQEAQLSAVVFTKATEWILYNRFYDIIYIAKGGFGKVHRALGQGRIRCWNNKNQIGCEMSL